MISEILIILLIIIVALIFLLFFNSWHLHVLFNNHNLDYNISLKINFLFIQIIIHKITSETNIILNLKIRSYKKTIITKKINSEKNANKESKEKTTNEDSSKTDENRLFSKIKQVYPLLLNSKQELFHIIRLVTTLIKFNNSYVQIQLGLGDNNKTIKLCNLLWTLTAPLYPLNLQVILTPQINQTILKSTGEISLNLKLTNVLIIIYQILKNKELREIINIIRG